MRPVIYSSPQLLPLLLPFTSLFTYPSRTFTDCGIMTAPQIGSVTECH